MNPKGNPRAKASMAPSSLLEAFVGKEIDDYVFFLDIRGTTAKLMDAWQSEDLLKRAEVAHCQTHFISALGALCELLPSVQAAQVSDCVFLHSPRLEDALDYSCAVFKFMTVRGEYFVPWSIRGGGGRGLNHFQEGDEIRKLTNLTFSSVLGVGNVQSATLEKDGPKGMRLFVTEEVADSAKKTGRFLLRKAIAAKTGKEIPCYEINWMAPDRNVPVYLGLGKKAHQHAPEQPMRALLRDRAKLFLESGVEHQVDLGASWADLLAWAENQS